MQSSAANGDICKLCKYVPQKARLVVYHSIEYSYLQYVIICWGNASLSSYIRKLQVIKSRLDKTITDNYKNKVRLKALHDQLTVLKIEQMFKLEVAKFMGKLQSNKIPQKFIYVLF